MRWLARCKFPLNAINLNQEGSMIKKCTSVLHLKQSNNELKSSFAKIK